MTYPLSQHQVNRAIALCDEITTRADRIALIAEQGKRECDQLMKDLNERLNALKEREAA
jgi:hypothetical protein